MNAGVLNRLVGERIIGRLAILPGTRFFVSPGARSVPLVAALAALRPDRVLTHYDERGMAFCALGHAKATGRLAVCITTSGSAVANLHPAITEAAHSNTPMLFLTADRPPELLDSGANQTIDQRGIFGPSVKWSTNLPCPAPENPPDSLVKRIDALLSEAVAKACGRPPGPVQLNCPFREP